MEFVGTTLHMLAFCAGALLFYVLLDRSRLVIGVWILIRGVAISQEGD